MYDLETKVLLIGQTGCGKTYLGRRINRYYPRKVIIDVKGVDHNEGKIVRNINDFVRELSALYIQKATHFSLIYKFPLGLSVEEKEEQFEKICELVLKFRAILFVVEEAHNFCSSHKITRWFSSILLMGRDPYKIALIMTTPKPSLIHNTITDMMTYTYVGTITGVQDRKFCANFMGLKYSDFEVLELRTFYEFKAGKFRKVTADMI